MLATTFASSVTRFGVTCLLAAIAQPVVAGTTYILEPLFPAGGGAFSFGYAISNSGTVYGDTTTGVGKRGTRWNAGTGELLETIQSGSGSGANWGNDNGWAVGFSSTSDGSRGAVWKPGQGNSPINIGNLGQGRTQSRLFGINDQNVAVGFAPAPNAKNGVFRAATWTEADGIEILPDFPGTNRTEGYMINNKGVVVGEGSTSMGVRAMRWQPGEAAPRILDSVSGNGSSTAWSVNDAGVAVGYGTTSSGIRATMWSADGTPTSLGNPINRNQATYAYDINEAGAVVGQVADQGGRENRSGSGGRRGWIWTAVDGMVLLDDLIDPSTPSRGLWDVILEANSINDAGQITGLGIFNGRSVAYVATPIPEPASFWLLASLLLPALARRRKGGTGGLSASVRSAR